MKIEKSFENAKETHNFSIFELKGKGKYLSARLELITIDNEIYDGELLCIYLVKEKF